MSRTRGGRDSIDETPQPLRPVQMWLESTTFRTPDELGIVAHRADEDLLDLKILHEEDDAALVDLVFSAGTLRVHARRWHIWHPFYVDRVEPDPGLQRGR